MEQIFYLVFPPAFIFILVFHLTRVNKMSKRDIPADYVLTQVRKSVTWKNFILPTIILIVGLSKPGSFVLIFLAALVYIVVLLELLFAKKYSFDSYLIRGDTLYQNGLTLTQYNLQELTRVNFMPFTDAFKLKFQGGQSVIIPRADFPEVSLIIFMNTAIEKSKLFVVVEDDAKTKIQMTAAALES